MTLSFREERERRTVACRGAFRRAGQLAPPAGISPAGVSAQALPDGGHLAPGKGGREPQIGLAISEQEDEEEAERSYTTLPNEEELHA